MKSKDFEIRTPFLGVGDPLIMSVCSYPSICMWFVHRWRKTQPFAEACKFLLADNAFKIPSPVAEQALQNAKALLEWVEQHQETAIIFEKKVTLSLQGRMH